MTFVLAGRFCVAARSEEGAYREYVTDERRSPPRKSARPFLNGSPRFSEANIKWKGGPPPSGFFVARRLRWPASPFGAWASSARRGRLPLAGTTPPRASNPNGLGPPKRMPLSNRNTSISFCLGFPGIRQIPTKGLWESWIMTEILPSWRFHKRGGFPFCESVIGEVKMLFLVDAPLQILFLGGIKWPWLSP